MSEHTPTEKREDIKADYEAEFEPTSNGEAIVPMEQVVDEVKALLAPSMRTQVHKLTLAYSARVREAEREVAEMAEREVALKGSNRDLVEHNKRLAAERDEWRAKVDPAAEIAQLREALAKAQAEAAGGAKLVAEHKARVDQLVMIVARDTEKRRALVEECEHRRLVLAATRAELAAAITRAQPRSWWRFWA